MQMIWSGQSDSAYKCVFTRLHSRVSVLKKYIDLEPYLAKVLPKSASVPKLLRKGESEIATESILACCKVCSVARCLGENRRVSGSRHLCLLPELYDTISLYRSNVIYHALVDDRLLGVKSGKESDDKALHLPSRMKLVSANVQLLSLKSREKNCHRSAHLWTRMDRLKGEINIK